MSVSKHHAIVVVGDLVRRESDGVLWIDVAWDEAVLLFGRSSDLSSARPYGLVSDMVVSPWNGIKSFLIAPDGSHEGPEESDVFDVLRGRFVEWVNAQVAVQGYPPVAWAEVVLEDEERIGGNEDGLVTYLSRSSRDGYPEEDE